MKRVLNKRVLNNRVRGCKRVKRVRRYEREREKERCGEDSERKGCT